MTRTGQAAADYARSRVGTLMPDAGLCLQFTRTCFDVAALYASAIDAGQAAAYPHPGDPHPPLAVPVYFRSTSIYDHVCVHVGGDEYVSTWNDQVRLYVGLSAMTQAFGPLVGWAEDLNAVRVFELEEEDVRHSFLSLVSRPGYWHGGDAIRWDARADDGGFHASNDAAIIAPFDSLGTFTLELEGDAVVKLSKAGPDNDHIGDIGPTADGMLTTVQDLDTGYRLRAVVVSGQVTSARLKADIRERRSGD